MVGLVLKVPKAVISQIEANKSEVSDKCYSKCNCVVIQQLFHERALNMRW